MLGTELLTSKAAMATIGVRNLAVAKRFYGETLGLTPVDGPERTVQAYRSGDSLLLVYESKFAGSNRATSVTWDVGEDLEDIVRALKSRGVMFEHYDMPGVTMKGDIHVGNGPEVAWFKDPDGNILSIVNG